MDWDDINEFIDAVIEHLRESGRRCHSEDDVRDALVEVFEEIEEAEEVDEYGLVSGA